MEHLSVELLPVVRHFVFSIFNISLPNLIIGVIIVAILFLGAWARLPHFIEQGRASGKER